MIRPRHLLWLAGLAGWLPLPSAAAQAPPASPPPPPPAAGVDQNVAEPTLVRPPKLKELIQAELPPGTVFPRPEIEVLLAIDVSETGQVQEVRVTQGGGEPFDTAARAAASRFEFEPALLSNGQTVPVTIDFRLRIREPPPPPPPPPAPVRFEGTLLERGTRRPLAGVEVTAVRPAAPGPPPVAEESLARAVTDDGGRFTLQVAEPLFLLRGAVAEHEPLEARVEAQPGEERAETFYLESISSGYETVVRAEAIRREVTRQVIPRQLVDKLPGTQGDTLKVVQNLPGVARASFGAGTLILRGASPGDSRTFLEGQEIPLLYHFGGLRSTFHSAFLDSLEFFPGNFAADYGRAIGGVIEVRTRDPATDLFRGQVDVNFYDFGVALEGPLGRGWSVGGAFHRSYIDTLLPLFLPDDVPLSFDTAPRYYDYQFLATWRPGAGKRLRLFWYGSMDRVELLFKRPAGDPQVRGALTARLMFHSLQAAYSSPLFAGLTQETSLQLGLQELDTQIGPSFFFNLGVNRLSLRSTASGEPLPWLGVRAGLDVRLEDATIALVVPEGGREGQPSVPASASRVLSAETQATIYSPGAFAELRLRPFDPLLIIPSLRVDWYRSIQEWALDPRLALRWTLRPGTVFAAGAGYYQQQPAPDEANELTGNPDLLPERSLQTSLGLEQQLFQGVELLLTGFYKDVDRLVIRNPATVFDAAAPRFTNDGTGRIYGLELQLKAMLGEQFQGWIAYTFQRSLRTDGPDQAERSFDFDQPHILTLVGTYRLGRGWQAGLRFRLVSGNPYTPVVEVVYDAASDTYVPRYGAVNSDRQATFHQLDLRVDRSWTFERWQLSAYLDVQNVYNRGNQEGWSYNFDYQEKQPTTGLPILPILGVRGEW